MKLAPLPAGQLYVLSGGKHYMDHRGHIYEQAPVTLPAAERVPTLPDPSLSPQALRYIEAEEDWLARQPVEHFCALYVDASGDVIGASRFDEGTSYQDGPELVHQIQVNVSELLREATRLQAAGVWTVHNHPGGSTQPSEADKTLSATLQQALHRQNIRLLASHIVPGAATPLTEASKPPLETGWDRQCWEHARLWSCYGGLAPWERRA